MSAEALRAQPPVRGTQSFVHTLSTCWRRPSLTALEVLWRWAFGIPALAAVYRFGRPAVLASGADWLALKRMTILDPMAAAATIGTALAALAGPVWTVARWLGPLLIALWIVVSSLGRTAVLRRADPRLHRRPRTLMLLQALRMAALTATFSLWFVTLQAISRHTIVAPLAAGAEPELVLYCALAIVTTLGLFVLWAVLSWALSVAPLLAMLHGTGPAASLRAAFRLGPLKSKLVEINLVMGIVKIALMVLGLVFSSTPLPFESIATDTFLSAWWAGVTVLYLLGSDFFHVARLVAYLELWRTFEAGASSPQR